MEDRWITQLPAFGPWNRVENRIHLEARLLVMAPPACKARKVFAGCVPFVDETSCDPARPGIQVLVTAPDREIDIVVVKAQDEISRSMCEVEAYDAALCVCRLRNRAHVKGLARKIVGIA